MLKWALIFAVVALVAAFFGFGGVAGVAATIAAFGPIHTVSVALAHRLLNESFATPFENAIGNFLAAQHRAISQSAFLDTLDKAQRSDG